MSLLERPYTLYVQKEASCGWDFSDTWAQTGGLPLLKNMDSARQQAAQK